MKSKVVNLALLGLAALAWAAVPASHAQSAAAGEHVARAATSTLAADLGLAPKPIFTAGCTAETQCPTTSGGSTTISCSGASSCSVGNYSVTCDGQTTFCGCVGCDFCFCDCLAGGGRPFQCVRECNLHC